MGQKALNFDNKEGKMPDLEPKIREQESIKHRVYMRDWYFNTGIVGFLEIISDGKDLDEIFVKLINSVNAKNYTDGVLLWVYKVVVKSMEQVDADDLKSGLDNLRNLYAILWKIKQAEAEDRARDWDPEVWLNNILDTID